MQATTCKSATWDDDMDVALTARQLGITEFQVFETAYRSWYNEPATVSFLERHFVRYMFEGVRPFWVRQFTRSTLRRWAEDADRVRSRRGAGYEGRGASVVDPVMVGLLAGPRLLEQSTPESRETLLA